MNLLAASLSPPALRSGKDRLTPLKDRAPGTLVIHEIYRSLQGEGTSAGLPCVFVRLTACHLRCGYCDTRHAFQEGRAEEPQSVLGRVRELLRPGDLIEVTGGEPLLQDEVRPFLTRLADTGHLVFLETSGTLDVAGLDPRARIILDVKTPGSGESAANLWTNLDRLRAVDELKFVVTDRHDFDWSVEQVRRRELIDRCPILVSPAHERVDVTELAAWILACGLPLRLQLQLHKQLWGAKTRGV